MSKKVLFMGTPSYATEIFKELLASSYEVVGIFTQEDKPVGRKQILTPPHIKQYCIDNKIDIPIFQPKKLKDNLVAYITVKELEPDFIIVAAYGQILPKEILSIAPCINLHASILPNYRGASPIQEGLLNDDNYLGVTSMFMEEGLDCGDILGFSYLKNEKDLLVDSAFSKLSDIAAKLTIITLDNFENIKPLKQNNSVASFCKKIKKEDGKIDFKSAKKLFLKYKAYSFWPGIFLESELKIKDIELLENISENKSGQILAIEKDYIIVGCQKGSLKIKTIQAPSKNAISAVDYLRGQRLEVGNILA
ncbi:methionyl-tRNA formyltransferase [Aliarcobacter cibarius]|uniref:Methionyl-tRNA formyltransferase n=1 Tax=Aliarcobacter cibarius TaxID=255507 RepID=A0A5J6RJP2_9BACT|nr:methionyl-tRNA formyltransferase [Aliarcobacter cibarius]QEZ89637.1 10-formyltetrahydrofolate:L-methionyl-tRNA(fMet) N-formyltransferase [Aliarcobacter cibarius]QKJ27644.1 10-formyltetrahydrofolate:L-methionyl-tRNA(fMet) N-formyltransferase [Aliarcobacter cibarius]TLT00682.1 methionyl-tRNA formyltransferase [Aliarcobacter cibarius]TLT00976.1 methionyl-tRNA formyltransferase [Aliarcobacter cibarius]TLT03880.1 methionyl-tRNA formyltransferase [Aliarcobacter cibarius]